MARAGEQNRAPAVRRWSPRHQNIEFATGGFLMQPSWEFLSLRAYFVCGVDLSAVSCLQSRALAGDAAIWLGVIDCQVLSTEGQRVSTRARLPTRAVIPHLLCMGMLCADQLCAHRFQTLPSLAITSPQRAPRRPHLHPRTYISRTSRRRGASTWHCERFGTGIFVPLTVRVR